MSFSGILILIVTKSCPFILHESVRSCISIPNIKLTVNLNIIFIQIYINKSEYVQPQRASQIWQRTPHLEFSASSELSLQSPNPVQRTFILQQFNFKHCLSTAQYSVCFSSCETSLFQTLVSSFELQCATRLQVQAAQKSYLTSQDFS